MNSGLSGFTLSRSSVLKFESAKLDFVYSFVRSFILYTGVHNSVPAIFPIQRKYTLKKRKYMSIMEGWKNVRCSIRIWASGIEREREKLFRTILTLIRNFYLFVFSPTFFVVYLSFNKMYIHIFPITFVKVYKMRLFINLAQIVLANFNGQIYYPFPGIFQYHSTMMFYSFEVHQSLNINRIVRVKSKSTCIP